MNIEAFFKISYGLYIVSSGFGEKLNGFISNTVFQVTAEPVQVAVGSSKNNFTTELIRKSNKFSISVLKQDYNNEMFQVFGFKSGRDLDKFSKIRYKKGISGTPIVLEDTIAWFECEVVETIDSGTHLIFIGRVIDNDMLDTTSEPLTYSYYHEKKKGFAPKNAPTYINPDKLVKEISKQKADLYYCPECSYVYDPENGDLMGNIPPGTNFDDLPGDWICPVCGTPKNKFIKKE